MQVEIIEYETSLCPQCGNLRSVCSREESEWYPNEIHCYATADTEVYLRQLRKQHKEPGEGRHHLDGLRVFVSDTDPDELGPGAQ